MTDDIQPTPEAPQRIKRRGRPAGTPNKPRPHTAHLRVKDLRADGLRVLAELAQYSRNERLRLQAAMALVKATQPQAKAPPRECKAPPSRNPWGRA